MFTNSEAFSGFSVDDLEAAKKFYSETLGLRVKDNPQGLTIHVAGNRGIFVYQKPDHVPATYTILNFPVDDIDQTVDTLASKGVKFEDYDGLTDDKQIARGLTHHRGPDIAWFKDPAGNMLAVMQEK